MFHKNGDNGLPAVPILMTPGPLERSTKGAVGISSWGRASVTGRIITSVINESYSLVLVLGDIVRFGRV